MIDREVVRAVLTAHFAVLARGLGRWPPITPREALADITIGEAGVMDHVTDVAAELLARARKDGPLDEDDVRRMDREIDASRRAEGKPDLSGVGGA